MRSQFGKPCQNVKSPLRLIVVSHDDQLQSHRILECGPCFDRIGSHLLCVHMINRWRGSRIGIEKHALPPDADVAADATSDLAELTAASNRILGADSASTGVDDLALLVWKQIVAFVTRCPLRELQDRGHNLACFQVPISCRMPCDLTCWYVEAWAPSFTEPARDRFEGALIALPMDRFCFVVDVPSVRCLACRLRGSKCSIRDCFLGRCLRASELEERL